MQLQGQSLINSSQFNSTVKQIENAANCEEVRELAANALSQLSAQQQAISEQLAKVQPLLNLLNAPTSPDAAVTWVKDFIEDYLTQQFKPALSYPTQLAQIAAQISSLQSAINSVSARFPNCSV